jgi:hypothetical protein
VSYSLSVAPDARDALADLDPWLAEEVLDEIELLLLDPGTLRLRAGEVLAVHDFVREFAGTMHYVFLVVRPSSSEKKLDVISIGHVCR